MSNKFYQPGARRATKVEDLFSAIAPRYDFINDLQSFGLHRWWKRRLVKLADVKPNERALDICCGTGDISFLLTKAGAETTGLDFSEAMLAVAGKRCHTAVSKGQKKNLPQFLRGDAQNLPLSDAHFDIITVGYGLRNLANWERGLEEMWRVAKPNARLLVLDFGKPDNALWRWLYFIYLRWFVPVFGKFFCGDPQTYAYILESLKHYPAQKGVAEKMRTLNGSNICIIKILGGMMTINYAERPAAPTKSPEFVPV